MPVFTRTDVTVVNSTYDTSGNGGRKLVRLDNGWLVSVARNNTADTTGSFYFYVSKDNGLSFTQLCYLQNTSYPIGSNISIVAVGTTVHWIVTNNNSGINHSKFDATTVTNTNQLTGWVLVDSNQTALGNVSLAINEAKTELHATWASKNSSYPNSFNIRYSKGVIQTDGSVIWSAVEQIIASNNSVVNNSNPTIVVRGDGSPYIIYTLNTPTVSALYGWCKVGSSWTNLWYLDFGTNIQANPSAIFVPKSINGLSNGRIWVTWFGKDVTNTTKDVIKVSYSDDGGSTWATQKIVSSTSGNCRFPSITVSKADKVYIVYELHYSGTDIDIAFSLLAPNATDFTPLSMNNGVGLQMSPSTLSDTSFSFDIPLTIYKDVAKVGFYGTWYENPNKPEKPQSISTPTSFNVGQNATVSWSAVPNTDGNDEAISYQVDILEPKTTNWINVSSGSETASATFTVPQLATGHTKIRVRAYDRYDYGEYIVSEYGLLIGAVGWNVSDATVINQAYDTSGNGGRKLVRLKSGNLYSVVKTTTAFAIYKSTDNGSTFTQFKGLNSWTSVQDVTVATDGNVLYLVFTYNNNSCSSYAYKEDGTIISGTNVTIDSSQSAMGNVSLAINEAKTELHATWASKNSSYPNAWNIRYAKGTINTDGGVTWGTVVQKTTYTVAGQDAVNPCIVVRGNNPTIFYMYAQVSNYTLCCENWDGASWGGIKSIYLGYTYAQLFPSAIFVPKSINGLVNGRIWVAWCGYDATDTSYLNTRVSYSDDGGITWSAMQKLTFGNSANAQSFGSPSITANARNELFIVVSGGNTSNGVNKLVNKTGTWGTYSSIKNVSNAYPSALYDPSLDFTEPLFIYKDTAKVGFYGTWSVTEISTPVGSIGEKVSKDNFFPYTVATGGTMSTITEKINGVTIGSKTATSGQSLAIGLTKEQWDEVRFGKYCEDNLSIPSNVIDWEQGVYDRAIGFGANKSLSTASLRLKSPVIVKGGRTYQIKVPSGYAVEILDTNSSNIVQSTSGWRYSNFELTTSTNATQLYVLFGFVGFATITPNAVLPIDTQSYNMTNTLTIEMGVNKWEYTFDKRLATDSDISSIANAVRDTNEVFLPAVKSELITAIRSKGGVVSDVAKWEEIENAIKDMSVKKFKSGTFTISGASVAVTGLGFRPKSLFIKLSVSTFYFGDESVSSGLYGVLSGSVAGTVGITRSSDGFTIPLNATQFPNGTWTYEATE